MPVCCFAGGDGGAQAFAGSCGACAEVACAHVESGEEGEGIEGGPPISPCEGDGRVCGCEDDRIFLGVLEGDDGWEVWRQGKGAQVVEVFEGVKEVLSAGVLFVEEGEGCEG